MNKEKELLLALLIEKYTKPQNEMIDVVLIPKSRKRRSRRPNINTHHWTTEEKNTVWRYRKQGYSFDKIAVAGPVVMKIVSASPANSTNAWTVKVVYTK